MRSTPVAVLFLVFALAVPAAAQQILTSPGPFEKSARPITPENPIPRRIFSVPPTYPPEALAVEGTAVVTLRVTLDRSGRIAEIRRLNNPFVLAPSATTTAKQRQAAGEAMSASAIAALSQWHYDAPADGPISFNVSFNFKPGVETASTQDSRAGGGGLPSGSVGGGLPAPPAPWPAAEGALRAGGEVRTPVLTRRVNPVYPTEAQAKRVQGVVILEAVVGENGRVRDVRVLRSIPPLDEAAIEAVKQWEYQPTMLNGRAVPVVVTVTVQFTMPRPPALPVEPAAASPQ